MSKKKLKTHTFPIGTDGEQVTFVTTKDYAEELYAAIKSYRKSKLMPSGASKQEELIDIKRGNGHGKALGLHLNELTREYELVNIDYNATEKTASIISVEVAGKLANRAYDALKIALIRNGVIR